MNDKHITLHKFLGSVIENNSNHDWWLEFEEFMKDYLNVDDYPNAIQVNEAFNDLLIAIYKRPENFYVEPNDQDKLYQKINYIRSSFRNYVLKTYRQDVRQEIKAIRLKQKEVGLDAFEESELSRLQGLIKRL